MQAQRRRGHTSKESYGPVRHPVGANRLRLVACLGVLVLGVWGVTACDDDDSPREPTPTTTSDEQPTSDEQTGSDEQTDTSAGDDPGAEAEVDTTAPDHDPRPPAGLPDDFPDVGVPFYSPAELVASPSAGDPWVLEFVTDHELTIVNNTIANEFSDLNGWRDVTREVNGQQTVTTGHIDGYQLVIAVAPEPSDDLKTSLYYTLSTQ